MNQASYDTIRSTLKTGDLVAFGGQSFISASIKHVTNSNVSHVGMVLKVFTTMANIPLVMLVESTSIGDGFAGVRISRLSTRIKAYDGDIWILPLDVPINYAGAETFMVSTLGIEYDYTQAIGSGLDFSFTQENKKDLDRLFCSELCNEVYLRNLLADADLIPENSSEQTPIDVCRYPIFKEVFQVSGNPKELI